MNAALVIFWAIFFVNLASVFGVWEDKRKSMAAGAPRWPETRFFVLAACGGSLGVFAGMFLFRHKTKKAYLPFGVGLILLQQLALAYLLFQKIQ